LGFDLGFSFGTCVALKVPGAFHGKLLNHPGKIKEEEMGSSKKKKKAKQQDFQVGLQWNLSRHLIELTTV
jgi:hypothetical protein